MRNNVVVLMLALILIVSTVQAQVLTERRDSIPADKGSIELTAIRHASLRLEYEGKVIYFDPAPPVDYSAMPKADYIFVTDVHPDHFNASRLNALKKEGTVVIGPAEVKFHYPSLEVLANGETKDLGFLTVEAIAAYNKVRVNPDKEPWHPKGRGNGYVLTLGGKRIYVSGDTECTPEVEALKNIDVAFVCMNVYTMDIYEAAYCVLGFKPKVVYPYHYRGQIVHDFRSAIKKGTGVEVRLLAWY